LGGPTATGRILGDCAWPELAAVVYTGSCLPWRHSGCHPAGGDFALAATLLILLPNGFVGHLGDRRTCRRAHAVLAGVRAVARLDLRWLGANSGALAGVDQTAWLDCAGRYGMHQIFDASNNNGALLVLLGLPGLYAAQRGGMGRLGLAGFLTAFSGTY
jgi:hypothetical protein